MSGGYARRVHRVMDHVRENLRGELSLEALAKVAHFSPYHFHRVFKSVTGETLTRFVQRSRLERAAYLMKSSPSRELGSIAHEVGFSAQSDFSRVFRKHYGVAPSDWDRQSRPLDDGLDDYQEMVAEARRTGPEPVARIVDREPVRLAYVRMRTPFLGPALQEGYAHLVSWLEARGVAWKECPLVGLSWDHYETTPLDQVHFDFGFGVGPAVDPEGDVGIHELPALRTAEVHCEGPLVRIAVAWDFLYDEWLPGSGHEPDDLPAVKRFRRRPDELGWEEWDLDCSIAIRPSRP